MSWWLVVLVVLGAFFGLGLAARRSWRRAMRRELVAALGEVEPGVTVVAERADALELRMPDGSTGTAFLHNFYAVLSSVPAEDEAQRREAVLSFARGLVSQQKDAAGPLDLERHGERLMPRLAPQSLLQDAGDGGLVHRDVGIPGLVVAYVLDSEHSVMYLTPSHLGELGVDVDALHERAVQNLRRTFPAAVVRSVVEKGQVTMVKAGDTFDATRLLLVPSVLEEGETVAAIIPDRETLGLMPPPPDGNWSVLDKLAREAASPYRLIDRPVRVTRAGFEVMG